MNAMRLYAIINTIYKKKSINSFRTFHHRDKHRRHLQKHTGRSFFRYDSGSNSINYSVTEEARGRRTRGTHAPLPINQFNLI